MFISSKEFAEKMQELQNIEDAEERHLEMDNLMCDALESLGYNDGVDIFENTDKYYGNTEEEDLWLN